MNDNQYFEARPHLLAAAAGDAAATSNDVDPVAALAAKHGPALASAALRNPSLTAAAMRSQGVSPSMANTLSNAAASAAKKAPPPAPPNSSSSSVAAASSPAVPPPRGPKGAAGLTSGRSLGSMPTSSGKAVRASTSLTGCSC
jgi:hypothetical protein